MTNQKIEIPYKPMPLQAKIHKSLKKFNVIVLHRGAGKSILAVNELIRRAFTCEDTSGAQFIYVAPEKQQAKDIIWGKLKYYTQNIPDLRIREDELSITFPDNNATIYLAGADNPDRLRGRHPHFVIMDEVGQMKRDVWYEVILPGTLANDASVVFIGTPKGDNLFKELYHTFKELEGKGDEHCYTEMLDVYNSGRFTQTEIELLKKSMPVEKFKQEYLLDWNASSSAAYYDGIINNPENSLVGSVGYNPYLPVITGWDLGTTDYTCIWFAQADGNRINIIDYYQEKDKDMIHYVNVLKRKPYVYDYHCVPFDVNKRFQVGKTRADVLKSHGFKLEVVPRTAVLEGISVVQTMLYKCRFDREKCAVGLRSLTAYCSKVDRITGESTGEPDHKYSDAADAFRYLIMGIKKPHERRTKNPALWFMEDEIKNKQKGRYQPFNVF